MRAVTRPKSATHKRGIALVVAPRSGHGRNVFRGWARRIQAQFDIPDEHVILFDERLPKPARFAFVNAEIRRIAASLDDDTEILTVFILRHGYPRGGQEGLWSWNVAEQIAAFGGRLAIDCNVVFFSCSNGATIGPNGDMSLADAYRDALCAAGFVWCMTFGHLIPGHAVFEIADRLGGTWRALARWFRGLGSRDGGAGGEEVLPKGHPLLPVLFRLIRKTIDPDPSDDVEEMMPFALMVPFMESREELVTYLERVTELLTSTGRADLPTTEELQRALERGGLMRLPTPVEGLGRFGPRTKAAVEAFQRAHGLAVDGDPGPLTWAALRAAGLLDAGA